jgi:hypothetical protein
MKVGNKATELDSASIIVALAMSALCLNRCSLFQFQFHRDSKRGSKRVEQKMRGELDGYSSGRLTVPVDHLHPNRRCRAPLAFQSEKGRGRSRLSTTNGAFAPVLRLVCPLLFSRYNEHLNSDGTIRGVFRAGKYR